MPIRCHAGSCRRLSIAGLFIAPAIHSACWNDVGPSLWRNLREAPTPGFLSQVWNPTGAMGLWAWQVTVLALLIAILVRELTSASIRWPTAGVIRNIAREVRG